ncbi:hypothetical protein ABK040_003512 [Willaertia magna]
MSTQQDLSTSFNNEQATTTKQQQHTYHFLDIPTEVWIENILQIYGFDQTQIPTFSLINKYFYHDIVPYALRTMTFTGKELKGIAKRDIQYKHAQNNSKRIKCEKQPVTYEFGIFKPCKELTKTMVNKLIDKYPLINTLKFKQIYLKKDGKGMRELLNYLNRDVNEINNKNGTTMSEKKMTLKIKEIEFIKSKGDFKSLIESKACFKFLEKLTFENCIGKILTKDFPALSNLQTFTFIDQKGFQKSKGKTQYMNQIPKIFENLRELNFLDVGTVVSSLKSPSLYSLLKLKKLQVLNCKSIALSKKKLIYLINEMDSLRRVEYPLHFKKKEIEAVDEALNRKGLVREEKEETMMMVVGSNEMVVD